MVKRELMTRDGNAERTEPGSAAELAAAPLDRRSSLPESLPAGRVVAATESGRVADLVQAPGPGAEQEIAPHIIEPAEQDGAREGKVRAGTPPDRGQRLGLAKASFIGLGRSVIMRMNGD